MKRDIFILDSRRVLHPAPERRVLVKNISQITIFAHVVGLGQFQLPLDFFASNDSDRPRHGERAYCGIKLELFADACHDFW